MKQLAGGKHTENDCFPRTLKFEMYPACFDTKRSFLRFIMYGMPGSCGKNLRGRGTM
jgi:hypothetical protein